MTGETSADPHPERLTHLGVEHFASVAAPPPAEARRAIGEDFLGLEEQEVHRPSLRIVSVTSEVGEKRWGRGPAFGSVLIRVLSRRTRA